MIYPLSEIVHFLHMISEYDSDMESYYSLYSLQKEQKNFSKVKGKVILPLYLALRNLMKIRLLA